MFCKKICRYLLRMCGKYTIILVITICKWNFKNLLISNVKFLINQVKQNSKYVIFLFITVYKKILVKNYTLENLLNYKIQKYYCSYLITKE